jgi:hypothetical protein
LRLGGFLSVDKKTENFWQLGGMRQGRACPTGNAARGGSFDALTGWLRSRLGGVFGGVAKKFTYPQDFFLCLGF